MNSESALDERTGWAYAWISSEWDRCFLVLTPGALRVFSCELRHTLERSLALARSVVGVQNPFALQDPKSLKKTLSKNIWKNLMKMVAADHGLSQIDIAILTIKPRKGKSCFLMFPSQNEADFWKAGVDEARALVEEDNIKKYLKKNSFRKSRSLQPATDAKSLFRRKSSLNIPFGLRWEASPPLLRVKQCSPKSSPQLSKVEGFAENERINFTFSDSPKPLWHDLETLQGCSEFLYSTCLNLYALEQASSMVDHFKGSYQMGDSSLPDELRLEAWKGTVCRIVKSLVDQILARNHAMESCLSHEDLMDQLWSASEMWVLGAVHDKIMGACKQMFADQDAALDIILCKLGKVEPSRFGVRAEFENFVLGEALEQFRMLNRLRTPYEKALCLQNTVKCIITGIQSLIRSCTGAFKDAEELLPCTDDLLSIMLLLMARAKVKNLQANACFMENFIDLRKDTKRGELAYHITNFSAACNYLQSSAVQELCFESSQEHSHVNQMPFSVDQSHLDSPSLVRNHADNFERSGSSIDSGYQTSMHRSRGTSRSYSLDSDGNSKSRDGSKSERLSQELHCYLEDSSNNWMSNSLHEGMEEDVDSIGSFGNPLVVNIFAEQSKTWWTERDDSSEDDRFRDMPIFEHRHATLALPGDSPDFILAPTYD